jgi:hypothetical protein
LKALQDRVEELEVKNKELESKLVSEQGGSIEISSTGSELQISSKYTFGDGG